MDLDTALAALAHDPSAPLDLAEVALLLARDEYPELDIEAHLCELAGMAHELQPRLRGRLSARVKVLCRYLFHDMGFRGNTKQYYDPRNSYLNDVLERRTGIPITLSAIAIAVGARAGLTVSGIGLPGHFIAKATLNGEEQLFDPFHGGRLLSTEECEALIEQVTGTNCRMTAELLSPVSLGSIVLRMLTNLKGVYLREGDFARAIRSMERLCRLVPDEPHHRRDLGAALLEAGEPGRAIDPLQIYVDRLPQAADAKEVRQLLKRACAAVAIWN